MDKNFIEIAVDKLGLEPGPVLEQTKKYLLGNVKVWLMDETQIQIAAKAYMAGWKAAEKEQAGN
jgi:hypothetical protein